MGENDLPEREPASAGALLAVQQMMQRVLISSHDAKIAFAISGGQATGAYEAWPEFDVLLWGRSHKVETTQ